MAQHKNKMNMSRLLQAIHAVIGVSLIAISSVASAATTTRTTGFDYDPQTGLLTKTVIEPGRTELCNTTVLTYDGVGNIETKKVRNCNGSAPQWPGATTESAAPPVIRQFNTRSDTLGYDATKRFVASTTNALNHTTSAKADERFGKAVEQTSAINTKVSHKFDGFGRPIEETRVDGTISRLSYLYCSNAIAEVPEKAKSESCPVIDALSGSETPFSIVLKEEFQSDGTTVNGPYVKQFLSVTGAVLRQETVIMSGSTKRVVWIDYQYDAKGRKRKESRPRFSTESAQWSEFEYDDLGRTTASREITSAGTATRETRYDGLITTKVNPLGKETVEERDEGGALASVKDALGNVLSLTYDAWGNQIASKDPKGNQVRTTFDDLGRRTVLADPNAGTITTTFDAAGQSRSVKDAKGLVQDYDYDALGRVTKRSASDMIATWIYDTCTNGKGVVCEASADNGTKTTYGYDTLGRVTSVKTKADSEYTYSTTYAASTGRPEVLTYPSGYQIKTEYDELGGPSKKVEVGTNIALLTINARDAAGHAIDHRYGNAVVATRKYHGDGRLLEYAVIGSQSLLSYQHGYKLNGLIDTRTEVIQGVVESYGYDALNRLTSFSRQGPGEPSGLAEWKYDAIGNLELKTSATGQQTQYRYGAVRPHAVNGTEVVGSGVTTKYQYDSNGNLEQGGGRSVGWYSFQKPLLMTAGSVGMRFQYSPDLDKVVETSLRNGATVRRTVTVRSGGETLYEETSYPSGQLTRQHYVYGEGDLVAIVSGLGTSATRSYSHGDYLGSVVANSNDGGVLTERAKYDPFGERSTTGNSAPSADLDVVGFTGHEHLLNVGLIDMKGRIYDPVLGKFLSPDPLIQNPQYLQSYNRYSYVWNNPANLFDPTGYAVAGCSSPFDGNPGCVPSEESNPLYWASTAKNSQLPGGNPPINRAGGSSNGVNQIWEFFSISGYHKGQEFFDEDAPGAKGKLGSEAERSEIIRAAWAASPNRHVAQSSACVGREGACATSALPVAGGWLLFSVSGRVALATFEIGSVATSDVPLLGWNGRVGTVAGAAKLAANVPRQIAAAWGTNTYRHGGLMTGIEHIFYRHAAHSGFVNVSRFAPGTRVRDVTGYVDSALRLGSVANTGKGAYTVEYNLGRVIGTDAAGNAASNIRVHVRDGIINTAFPF